METLIPRADAFAERAHAGQVRKVTHNPYIDHPRTVAELVSSVADDEHAICAALLHDTVEDTEVTIDEIEAEFGTAISELVEALSEDKSITPYTSRKRHHLEKVAAAGTDACLVFAADKLANAMNFRDDYVREGEAIEQHFNAPLDTKIPHMREEVDMLQSLASEHAGLDQLAMRLDATLQELEQLRSAAK